MSALIGTLFRLLLVLTIVCTVIQQIDGAPKKGKKGYINLLCKLFILLITKCSAPKKEPEEVEAEKSAAEDGQDMPDIDGQEEFAKIKKKFKDGVKKVKESGLNWDDLKPKDHMKVDDLLKETAENSKKSLDNPVDKQSDDNEDDNEEGDGKDDKKEDDQEKNKEGDDD